LCHGRATIVADGRDARKRSAVRICTLCVSHLFSLSKLPGFSFRALNVHRPSTMCAQVFHSGAELGHNDAVRAVLRSTVWAVLVVLTAAATAAGQAAPSGSPALDVFRIFLRDGRVLSSYGEFAQVDADLVFVVAQGEKGGVQTHDLITVPVAVVDMERTTAYASALRMADYAALRGEREYQALIADITRAVTALKESDDKDRRLGIAIVARRRLLAWSADHFGYRAAELRQIVSIIDDVILDLQAATGTSQFSIDLVASVTPPPPVPLMTAPTPVETVKMALIAATTTDVGVEKLALLRSANRVAETLPDADAGLRSEVARLLAEEIAADAAYRLLLREALTRADAAVRQGKPVVIRRLILDVESRDATLGHRRPRDVAATLRKLWSESGLAVDQQLAFERWALVKDQLRAYEARVRSAHRAWTRHASTLSAIKKGEPASPGKLDAAARDFSELDRVLVSLRPPDELVESNGIFRSAVQLVQHGLLLGQRLAVAPNAELSSNASSAMTGADLLHSAGVKSLATALQPRRVR